MWPTLPPKWKKQAHLKSWGMMVTASKVMLLVGATNWKSGCCTEELTTPLITNLSLRSYLWKRFAFIVVLEKNNKGGSAILQGTRGERMDEKFCPTPFVLSKAPPTLPSHSYFEQSSTLFSYTPLFQIMCLHFSVFLYQEEFFLIAPKS